MDPATERELDLLARLESGKLRAAPYIDEEIMPAIEGDILSEETKQVIREALIHLGGGSEALTEMLGEYEEDLYNLRDITLKVLSVVDYLGNKVGGEDSRDAIRLVTALRQKLGASA